MNPKSLYQIHQEQLAKGYTPYPFACLLDGAPLFTWRGWFLKLFARR
jgi:hypothetical protein